MAHMAVLVWIAGRMGGRRLALWCAVFLAVPPLYLTNYAALVYPSYLGVLVLGALGLYLLWRIGGLHGNQPALFFLLGAALGLAFWEHATSLALVAFAGGMLLLFSPAKLVNPKLLGSLLAGIWVGGLPMWLWNLGHDFNSFRCLFGGYGGMTSPYSLGQRVWAQIAYTLPSLLGLMSDYWSTPTQLPFWRVWFWLLYIPFGVFWIVRLGRHLETVAKARRPELDGADIFLLYGLAVLAIATVSGRTGERYILTIFSSWPLLAAFFVNWLGRSRYPLGALFLAGLALMHLHDNGQFLYHNFQRLDQEARPVDGVIAYLKAQRLGHAYGHYRVSREITFESREQIIAADFHGYKTPLYEGFEGDLTVPRRYLNQVDLAPRKAIVTHGRYGLPYPRQMDQFLTTLGTQHYTRHETGPYVVYHDFQQAPGNLEPIPLAGWQVRASPGRGPARAAIDRRADTYWSVPQEAGTHFEMDLKQPRRIAKILMQAGALRSRDYPLAVTLEVSTDGRTWNLAAPQPFSIFPGLDWLDQAPRLTWGGGAAIHLNPPLTGRYLRVKIDTAHPQYAWTISELYLFGPGSASVTQNRDPTALEADLRQLLAHLPPAGGELFLYPEYALGPYLKPLAPKGLDFWDIYAVEGTLNAQRQIDRTRDNRFLLRIANLAAFEEIAARAMVAVQEIHRAGGLVSCALRFQADSSPLYWSNEGLLTLQSPDP
jgi:hypothetical protein